MVVKEYVTIIHNSCETKGFKYLGSLLTNENYPNEQIKYRFKQENQITIGPNTLSS